MDMGKYFENTIRVLLGDKADNYACSENNPKHRSKWLQEAICKITRDVNELDTNPSHKKLMMNQLDEISQLLIGIQEPSWELIYRFLRLVSMLLGYEKIGRGKCYSHVYWQTPEQCYFANICNGGDVRQHNIDKQDAISIRQSIVGDLKSKGHNDFKISLVLNTTEKEVKQLRSKPSLKGTRRRRNSRDQTQ
jgi:hypothetical protein